MQGHLDGLQEEWRYSSIILNLHTRMRGVVSLSPQPQHPINRWRTILDILEKKKLSCICLVPNPRF
jgi:hypothetical protein